MNYNWPLQKNAIDSDDLSALLDFLKSTNRYTQGEKVKEFEAAWSKWQGCKYSVFVNSGSSANLILIDCLKEYYGWTSKDKIIVPSVTWSTNINPVIQCDLHPLFVDINLSDLSFDIQKLEKVIKSNEHVRGIFVTHLLGLPASIFEIKELCNKYNLKIFEDCCEAHGAIHNNEKVGNFGEGGTFLFTLAII